MPRNVPTVDSRPLTVSSSKKNVSFHLPADRSHAKTQIRPGFQNVSASIDAVLAGDFYSQDGSHVGVPSNGPQNMTLQVPRFAVSEGGPDVKALQKALEASRYLLPTVVYYAQYEKRTDEQACVALASSLDKPSSYLKSTIKRLGFERAIAGLRHFNFSVVLRAALRKELSVHLAILLRILPQEDVNYLLRTQARMLDEMSANALRGAINTIYDSGHDTGVAQVFAYDSVAETPPAR